MDKLGYKLLDQAAFLTAAVASLLGTNFHTLAYILYYLTGKRSNHKPNCKLLDNFHGRFVITRVWRHILPNPVIARTSAPSLNRVVPNIKGYNTNEILIPCAFHGIIVVVLNLSEKESDLNLKNLGQSS